MLVSPQVKSSSIFQLIANVNSKNIKEIESEHKAILLQNICYERNWPYKKRVEDIILLLLVE